jgi:tetratricopeptide (TPR) repeat protein
LVISRKIIPVLVILAGLGTASLTHAQLPKVTAPESAASQTASDWQAEIRALLAAGEAAKALALADRRLDQTPGDLEARGWRARVLVRLNRAAEAAEEYRTVLATAPGDTDMLYGLGDALARQQRFEEALAPLDRARRIDPRRADVAALRGRVLRALGRRAESREAFQECARLEPGNAEARAGLASLDDEPRHQLVIGTDIDTFNYTDTAGAFTASLTSHWQPRWTTSFSESYYDRFGGRAAKFTGSATFKPTKRDGITAGASLAHDDGVIPKSEAFYDLDHGFNFGKKPFVRGVELDFAQHWLWFRSAHILTYTPSAIFYLPRDWIWSLNVTEARSSFPGLVPSWQPSGSTKLQFPLVSRLGGNIYFAVGSEDFSRTDQIGRFAARTWGGGLHWQFARRQEVSGTVFNQDRSQRRSQTSFGFAYGLRF